MKKRVLALALSAVMCLALLTGCGGAFSAGDLVQHNLDLIYLNQYDSSYLKQVDLTEEEADQQYEDGIAVEVEYFCNYFNIDLDACDDTIEPQITELYKQIYPHSKYEVGETTKNGDNYDVELTIYPIDIMQKVVEEDAEAFAADWQARGEAGEFYSMTDEEFETAWAQGIIDLIFARVATIGYLDAQTMTVHVEKDTDGVYAINSDDFSNIDAWIIAY